MKKRIKSLGELQKHLSAMIKKHGEAAPCAAWLITREDFTTVDDNMREVSVTAQQAKSMIDDMHLFEYAFIDDHLRRIIDNEKLTRKL
tara:strand:+ start:122 stop:385 length:264 start_codon:yes stop_codon:yes gene_type:complete